MKNNRIKTAAALVIIGALVLFVGLYFSEHANSGVQIVGSAAGSIFGREIERLAELGTYVRLFADSVYLIDVDFDGVDDILVAGRNFGPQGAVAYSCFLRRGDTYEYCQTFPDIPNAAVDPERREILSSGYDSGTSRFWAKYAFEDGGFVMTERLTAYVQYDAGQEITKYCIETRGGNGADNLTIDRILDMSDAADEMYAGQHILAPDSTWSIQSNKWSTVME